MPWQVQSTKCVLAPCSVLHRIYLEGDGQLGQRVLDSSSENDMIPLSLSLCWNCVCVGGRELNHKIQILIVQRSVFVCFMLYGIQFKALNNLLFKIKDKSTGKTEQYLKNRPKELFRPSRMRHRRWPLGSGCFSGYFSYIGFPSLFDHRQRHFNCSQTLQELVK